ncbi:MAG: glycosyltransferase [Pseudomonadota bacterium]|nr:glycosyltransferase [Pseudomonadota bacterium]
MLDNHAEEAPGDLAPCEIESAAHDLLKITDERAFQAELRALDERFPGSHAVFASRVRRLIRTKATSEATALIDGFDFGPVTDALTHMRKAELLYEAHEFERADGLFKLLMETDTDHRRDVAMRYAKKLFTDGSLVKACEVLEPVRDRFSEGGKGHAQVVKFETLRNLLTALERRQPLPDENCRIVAMKHAILHFRNRTLRSRGDDSLGRLTLMTGGLGPGGAERQLTRLAMELDRARMRSGAVGGVPLDRPVEVLVRSHGPEKQNDFYLADIESAGVELHQINGFEVVPPKNLGIEDPELLLLLDYLPPSVNYGVRRLTRHFVTSGTDTASIWQDGACLFGGLAALIAGVPQVQLSIRGLPPSMRRHMFRPEYEVFYRAMAQVPGVTFVSNSISAARAYAEWLDVSPDRVAIVYNGVEPMSPEPSPNCEERWSRFVEATPEATHTVGGVFRFDTDKQPLLWIRFAARYLKRHPDSRMLLVGGGRLLDNAVALAEEYGIQDRILFVGRSTRVGFWMTKMDVLVLLSRFEGLPNVLIEAQYMGVRVITTPAGGAAECVIDGATGHVLGCAERPDYAEIVENAHQFAMQSQDSELFAPGGVGRTFLDSHFSIPHMLAQYVTCTSNGLGPAVFVGRDAQRSLRAA